MAEGSPCKDCNKRCIGCHSFCEAYLEIYKVNQERYKARAEFNENKVRETKRDDRCYETKSRIRREQIFERR